MTINFIVDENLPPVLASWLRDAGHEAVHVFEVDLGGADDSLVWEFARQRGATLITKDQRIIRRHVVNPGPSVVLVCFGNATNKVVIDKFSESLAPILGYLGAGAQLVELR